MAQAIDYGEAVFTVAKMGITCTGLLLLLMRVRFRGVRRALVVVLGLYMVLMAWHGAVRVMLPAPEAAPALAAGAPFCAPLVELPSAAGDASPREVAPGR